MIRIGYKSNIKSANTTVKRMTVPERQILFIQPWKRLDSLDTPDALGQCGRIKNADGVR